MLVRSGCDAVVDCAFCIEFAAHTRPGQGSRIIDEVGGWVLLPTIGCFTPGYCLFMPIDHIDAAADVHTADGRQTGAAGR